MNYAVDGQHRDTSEVVREFLSIKGSCTELTERESRIQITNVPRNVSTALPLKSDSGSRPSSHQSSPPRSDT